jgi:glycosyltransferase involved in cell wall biosynthesis
MKPPLEVHSLTVVMPVYNEAATLRSSLEKLLKVDLPLPLDVIIVDDGSTDGCMETVADLVDAEGTPIRVMRHEVNAGKGAAIQTALASAKGDLLTILDADMEYDVEDYKRLLRPILDGDAAVVYGTRHFGAHTVYSFWFVLGNRALAFWASFLYNTWLSDIHTCFKLAPTELWRSMQLRSNGFGLDTEVTAKILKRGYRIYELPISYRARDREAGKKLSWTDGFASLWLLLRVRILR